MTEVLLLRMWNILLVNLRKMTNDGQLRRYLEQHLFRVQKSQRIVTFMICDIQIHLLIYLLITDANRAYV